MRKHVDLLGLLGWISILLTLSTSCHAGAVAPPAGVTSREVKIVADGITLAGTLHRMRFAGWRASPGSMRRAWD